MNINRCTTHIAMFETINYNKFFDTYCCPRAEDTKIEHENIIINPICTQNSVTCAQYNTSIRDISIKILEKNTFIDN